MSGGVRRVRRLRAAARRRRRARARARATCAGPLVERPRLVTASTEMSSASPRPVGASTSSKTPRAGRGGEGSRMPGRGARGPVRARARRARARRRDAAARARDGWRAAKVRFRRNVLPRGGRCGTTRGRRRRARRRARERGTRARARCRRATLAALACRPRASEQRMARAARRCRHFGWFYGAPAPLWSAAGSPQSIADRAIIDAKRRGASPEGGSPSCLFQLHILPDTGVRRGRRRGDRASRGPSGAPRTCWAARGPRRRAPRSARAWGGASALVSYTCSTTSSAPRKLQPWRRVNARGVSVNGGRPGGTPPSRNFCSMSAGLVHEEPRAR